MQTDMSSCKSKSKLRSFDCPEFRCNPSFKTSHDKKKHLGVVHNQPIEGLIGGCGDIMKKASRSAHMKLVHGRVEKECPNSDKKKFYGNMSHHSKICLSDGTRPFKCGEEGCESNFKTARDRSKHTRAVHTEQIDCPFPDCDARIKKASLTKHVKLIHDKLKETCKNCGKLVAYNNLSRHLKTCTSDAARHYKCGKEDCQLTFRTVHERLFHNRAVHKQPIACSFPKCNALIQKAYMSEHVRRVHHTLNIKQRVIKQASHGSSQLHIKSSKSNKSGSLKNIVKLPEIKKRTVPQSSILQVGQKRVRNSSDNAVICKRVRLTPQPTASERASGDSVSPILDIPDNKGEKIPEKSIPIVLPNHDDKELITDITSDGVMVDTLDFVPHLKINDDMQSSGQIFSIKDSQPDYIKRSESLNIRLEHQNEENRSDEVEIHQSLQAHNCQDKFKNIFILLLNFIIIFILIEMSNSQLKRI